MKFLNLGLSITALVLPFSEVVAGGLHHRQQPHHADVAKRAEGNIELWKRIDNSKWSFYDVGLGACGRHNVASDFIVALNAAQFGGGYPGPNCFRFINMRYNGKSARAQIMDRCPGCPYGGLDLSRGLFRHFDSESKGIIYGSWTFEGEGGPAPPPPPPPRPPRTTVRPTPTFTYRPPTPTRTTPRIIPTTSVTIDLETTRTRTRSRSSSASSTASASPEASNAPNYSSGAASGLAVPVATGVIENEGGQPENLNNLNLALVGLGALIVAGAGAD